MMRIAILTILITAILLIDQAYAIDQIFTNDTTITVPTDIKKGDTWTVEDGVTLKFNAPVTNNGIIIVKGTLMINNTLDNNGIIRNFGTVVNNDTLTNTYYVTNHDMIINNGVINNTYVLNNLGTINNTGIIANKGYSYNFGNIYNNMRTDTGNGTLALFPATGQIINNGSIIKPARGVSFFVVPESPIGIIALLMTSIAVFVVYTYRRTR